MPRPILNFGWNDPRLVDLREEYGLQAVPSVLLFDKNLNCIHREGADDLLNMSMVACRNYWIDIMNEIVRGTAAFDKENEDDD